MGDVLVSVLVRDVLRTLTSLAIQELGAFQRFKDDILVLTDDLKQIQSVLEDAEEKYVREKAVELWLSSLKSASLKVENVLEEVSTEVMLRRLHKELGIKYRVRAFCSSNHNQLMFRFRISQKVKSIRKILDGIAAKRVELNLTPHAIVSVDEEIRGEIQNRETSSLIHSSIIYGRDEEMEMVIKKICNNNVVGKHDSDNIRVYAIWGMGGLGKTTLAQLVYNHETVNKHFELKCWRYVSQKFKVKELIRGIIEDIDKTECTLSNLDKMQKSLQEKLRGKRFLIVLDDVWIEDSEKTEWDKLAISLSSGAEGSIVMVTTRNQTTSRMLAKVPDLQHELGYLSKANSWSLFEKFAFAEGRMGGDKRELEPIGMEIVEKCKGLPLAVKTLGSLMWSKSTAGDWERVKGSDIWQLQVNNILPALKLSYDNLLPHLKRCFAYCCLFPKGYETEMDDLILLWMSNGLIPLSGADDLVRGEEMFNFLVWRSFFQVVDEKYKMHDLMHDLARYVMRHDCLITEPGKELITPDEVLHLSSSHPDFLFLHYEPEKLRSLRSIFIFTKEYDESFSHIFEQVYLRVLYMVGINLTTLPESICKLKYLKYLNLSSSMIQVLPKSIICLQNLQVLLLEGCWRLYKLPEGMRYMKNLRHLNNKACLSLGYLPVGIKELTRLKRLSNFPIDDKNGSKIGELGDLNLLEGELLISGLENVESLSEAKNANLKCKRNLLVLILEWRHQYFDKCILERIVGEDEVLEGLEPNPNLKELVIFNCIGKIASLSWMVKLQNLVKITFDSCNNCEQIPSLGKLRSLKVIILQRMDSLKCFDDDDDDNTKSGDKIMFPVLQELIIEYCPSLIFLPRNFPNLKTLRLEQCKSLRSLPDEIQSFKDLNKLSIDGCEFLSRRYEEEIGVDWPKIAHIPFIHIDTLRL